MIRILSALLLPSVVLALAAVVAHQFFGHITTTPAMGIDEILGNVSFTLAERGQYGLPASPVQTKTDLLRLHGFFNYGPWYFGLGAAGVWLFDDVLTIHRSLHPLGVAAACGLCFLIFRTSPLAWAIFTALAVHLFRFAEWPMARPDITGAVFAIAAIAASTTAMKTTEAWNRWWCLAGFLVGAAVTSHPVFWALVPALGISLAVWALTRGRPLECWRIPDRSDAITVLAAVGGGSLALLVFLISINFRLGDYLTFVTAYGGEARDFQFVQVIRDRWAGAWGTVIGLNLFSAVLAASTAIAAVSLPASFMGGWRRFDPACLSMVLPPLLFWVCYDLSLVFYPKYHQGYAVFSHWAAAWTAAVGIVVAGRVLGINRPGLTRVLAAIGLAAFSFRAGAYPPPWAYAMDRWVSHEAYGAWLLDSLPRDARVVGALPFAQRSGDRLQIIGLTDAISMFRRIPPDRMGRVAPTHMVLSHYETSVTAWMLLVKKSGQVTEQLVPWRLVDQLRLETAPAVVGTVWAPPYGLSKVYRLSGPLPEAPWFMVNEGVGPQWLDGRGAPLSMEPPMPAATRLRLSWNRQTISVNADAALRVEAPAGLLTIRLVRSGAGGGGGGIFMATSSDEASLAWGELPPVPTVVYFGTDAETEIIVDHPGGPLWLSQFDANDASGFKVAEIRPVTSRAPSGQDQQDRDRFVRLPIVASWVPSRLAKAVAREKDMTLTALSPGWGHLLESPLFELPHGGVYQLDLSISSEGGETAIGILDDARGWILPPDKSGGRLRFSVDRPRMARIVVAANAAFGPLNAVVRNDPRLRPLGPAPGSYFVDQLTRCFRGLPIQDLSGCSSDFIREFSASRRSR